MLTHLSESTESQYIAEHGLLRLATSSLWDLKYTVSVELLSTSVL